MTFLHNIRTVALYEAKTLRRSWFFRLFTIGALFIFTIMNIGIFSPIGEESWDMISIPSSLPLVNLYLLNLGQSIVVIFLAADFLKRDKKLDTNEVLYTRSMSNFEYITGKTWGILRLFLGLDILILAIGMLINIISQSMHIDFMSYLAYLLIICVPTLVFSLGLAFLLMSLIRNQPLTFLILLGIAALNMFYMWFRMGFLFDYMAFGLPVFKSGIIGFDNLNFIITQRLLYLFLGLAKVLTTALLFKRLPQSIPHRVMSIVLLLIFLSGAVFCGFSTYSVYKTGVIEKETAINTNRQFENKNFATTTDVTIDFIHKGESFSASAYLTIRNENKEPLTQYFFSLNPALIILKISSAGKKLTFRRTGHIIEIDPEISLGSGQTDSVLISYEGGINESFCYPDYNENIKDAPYRIAMLNVNKRQAFLTDNFLLLTPETHWYPVSSLNYYPSNPARISINFTNYTLRVKKNNELTAVSQGLMTNEEGYSVFTPESPLTGLTLVMGNYKSDTLKVDSVNYISYYFPGNDYYKKDLVELKDTLPHLVSGIMRELETNFSTNYPFKTLSLVEVPVQFYSLPKKNTQTRAEVQPSMVLLPEKLSTIDNAGFNKRFTQQKKRMEKSNQVITDKELQVRLFNDFIRNTFISGENFRYVNGVASNEPVRYRLGPSFYFFKNNFYSTDFPVINSIFESHLQKISTQGPRRGFQSMLGNLSDNDKANLILKDCSFKEILAKNPGGDTLRTILSVKGDWIFNFLRAKAGIDEFNLWFSDYIDQTKFKRVDIQQFNNDVKEKFGFEFYSFLNEWFNGKEQPGFLFSNLKVSEIIIGDRSKYQVTLVAANPENIAGLFNISFRTGEPGGGGRRGQMAGGGQQGSGGFNISMQGRGMETADISKVVFIAPQEAKRIGIILDAQPRAVLINTLFAKNVPGEINMPVNEIVKEKSSIKEFSGEETLSALPEFLEPSEIVIDNEDPGLIKSIQASESPLKKILGIKNKDGDSYKQISTWNIPEYWQPIVQTTYYGKYIRSALYTRGGTGERTITWNAIISEPGYYDIYCYIGKGMERMRGRSGEGDVGTMGNRQRENQYKDMHYTIYHDEGSDEITVDYENADGGWNNLGRYYLSPDTAKVSLSNQTSGKIVIGDAVKWVKQN
jgi:hypothetical protein